MSGKQRFFLVSALAFIVCGLWVTIESAAVIYDHEPDWSRRGQAIVFGCYRQSPLDLKVDSPNFWEAPYFPRNFEICTMAPDGSQRAYLTDNTVADYSPSFSPDGTQIAFLRSQWAFSPSYLYLMNSDGSQQRRVSNSESGGRFKWPFDGSRIAFGIDGLHVFDVKSNVERRQRNGHIWDFAWSPDSQRIAFVLGTSLGWPHMCEIHIITADDGRETISPIPSGCEDLAWSPSGQYLAFYHHEFVTGAGRLRLALNVETAQVIASTHRLQSVGVGGGMVWSPDSDKIYSMSDGEIYVANTDGSGEVQITNLKTFTKYPKLADLALSPDGKQSVFTLFEGAHDGRARIWKMSVDGTGLQQLSP